ncbi:YIP1 family protein [Kitasatospora sp. RG8]|uniref:Yip1 family protein n=1 Tax=Kitasatospora sp. RG8 TaxID=2820815 RepID=UPI001ADFCC5B|nr:Yip1 family protein [Kitasatospora sp. RG8]MBP0453823.1 YIP1 family protein [Kitasatospora sp. RG8]
MAGNRYDSGQGAEPRGGWSAPPPPPGASGGYGQPGGYGQTDGPEYFTAPHRGAPGGGQGHGGPGGHDPYAADQPGHTRAFPTGGDPYGGEPYPYQGQGYPQEYGQPYPDAGQGGYGGQGGYDGQAGYDGQGGQYGYGQEPGYAQEQGYAQDNVAVYRAGGQSAPHVSGPRPAWRELLVGIFRNPTATFDRTRDHQVWLPALTVSLLYGALAVLGIGLTRDDVFKSTFGVALTAILAAAVCFTLAGAVLGGVTYALARQFGGDGPWKSTVGLAVLIGWMTDAPRLLLALVLPSDNMVVQVVGWATWVLCAVLLTTMVRRLHDLPWGKAAGAAALQLLALLVLIKLPTLG